MIQRQVVLPASTDEVWHALTDPEEVAGWFGATVRWELEPGGPARFEEPGGVRAGRVVEVAPGRRLRFCWWPEEDEGDASEVTYELDPDDDGTRLVVTEQPVDPTPAADVPAASAQATWSDWDGRLFSAWVCAAAGPVACRR